MLLMLLAVMERSSSRSWKEAHRWRPGTRATVEPLYLSTSMGGASSPTSIRDSVFVTPKNEIVVFFSRQVQNEVGGGGGANNPGNNTTQVPPPSLYLYKEE